MFCVHRISNTALSRRVEEWSEGLCGKGLRSICNSGRCERVRISSQSRKVVARRIDTDRGLAVFVVAIVHVLLVVYLKLLSWSFGCSKKGKQVMKRLRGGGCVWYSIFITCSVRIKGSVGVAAWPVFRFASLRCSKKF